MENKIIKEAFSKPARELRAKVTIGDKVFTDEHLESIRAVTGLSESNDFEVGTAFMASATIKLVDKYENFRESNFKDKLAKVEIGVKTPQDFDFTSIGEFIVDSVGNNMKSWELKCYDRMHKFNVKYDCKLTFPTSLKNIVLDICNICGVEPSDNIKNSALLDRIIKFKPNFYDMTAREVLAQVAELICAWAYIDVDSQKLDISSYAVDDEIKINDDNLISFKEYKNTSNSDCKILLDSVKIIQNGADDADYNPDSPRKFHIVDNMFIQGNGADYIDNAKKSFRFNELSALSVKYNGNPGLRPARCVKVIRAGKEYNFLPLVRKLTYNGGLVEECECKQINYDPANRRKEIVRHVEKINALLKVMDNKIQSKVGTEDFQTLVEQTKEEIKLLAKNINLEGYVKFEDLKKQNKSTVIHGGNITTGVIQSKDGGFGIDLDNKTFFLGRDLEHYALLFDGRNLKFGEGGIKSDQFSEGLKQELKGQDGQSQYVHTRYSDSGGDVGSMHVNAVDDSGEPYKYIGFAITNSSGAPALKSEYKWSKYVGDDGSNGTPGRPGTDGKTPYFHVAWADNSSGSSGFTTSGGKGKSYMGTYTDFTEGDSDDYRKYTWVKVKGENGEDGKDGKDGKIKYNLISNGDFHRDFTKDEAGFNSSVLNKWQVGSKSIANKMYTGIASEDKVSYLHVSPDGARVEINQYLALKKNTTYYVRAYVASKKMTLYYHGENYNSIETLTDKYSHFEVINKTFRTHDSDTHYIQLDCSDTTQIRYIIISEEEIPYDEQWYPSKFDGLGQDGKQGPPGKDGSLAELPPALKAWNGNATEISGKYVFTPELFVGTNKDSPYSRTGIYMGSNIRAKGLFGDMTDIQGLCGISDGQVTWNIRPNGAGWIGSSNRAIVWNSVGEIHLPKITSEEITTGAITTDILYPGNGNRIVLEHGYQPGENNCMSIDTNGGRLRIKADANTYLNLSKNGTFSFYAPTSSSSSRQVFIYDPKAQYELEFFGDKGRGEGRFTMSESYLEAKAFKGQSGFISIMVNDVHWTTSDRRMKTDIEYIGQDMTSKLLDFIKNVNIAEFYYKSDEKKEHKQISVIAQDVIKDFPELKSCIVNEIGEYYTVNSNNINFATIVALQTEIKKREELENRVTKLENEMAKLKALLLKKEGGVNA